MVNFKSLRTQALLTAITLSSSVFAQQPQGIIGGQDNTNPAYSAFFSPTGTATTITTGLSMGFIRSVAINLSGLGIIGGQDESGMQPAYAAFVPYASPGTPTLITTGLTMNSAINSVAINASGTAIIGGENNNTGAPYAAFVSFSSPTSPTQITSGLPAMGVISSVAINTSGTAIIGGTDTTNPAFAAFVPSSSSTATPITLGFDGFIDSVAINDSGVGIVGGRNNTGMMGQPAYAAYVTTSAPTMPVLITSTLPTNGFISSVGINASGNAVIGGRSYGGAAYAALVSNPSSPVVTQITTGLPAMGIINSVAINASGNAIIGGSDFTGPAYAAIVSPTGTPMAINTGLTMGSINSVAINVYGYGVIGGQNNANNNAYAAIVSPTGVATQITTGLPSNGVINSVAISDFISTVVVPILSYIPTASLSGNNLNFANYINQYAEQDAFYFVPAALDGTLAQALESAAPTRNAFSLYTASNNMFYLTTNLSNHLHNGSRQRRTAQTQIAAAQEVWNSEELLASIEPDDQLISRICQQKKKRSEKSEEKKNSIWFEAIGALAYQKPQHQTPGFDPITGGGILAFDGKTSKYVRVGAGAAYLYTHIHEDQGAGHSNINQEDLFAYASWENKHVYLDGSVLGGLFQINQVRDIKMTGFEFKSTSKPHGWQLLPHLELGYHYTWPEGMELTINPFIMVDWANAWEKSFKERGSGPFNVAQKSHHSSLLRSEASLRMYETVFFDSWDLIFQEKAGYVNVHSSRTGNVNAFLVGSPGSFTVTTLTGNQNLGVAEFAMIFAPHSSGYPISTLFYQGEFGSKYQSHQVALELAWNF